MATSYTGQKNVSDFDRFLDKFVCMPNGCWQWIAGIRSDGYSRFNWNLKKSRGHRFSYKTFVGELLPDMEIDHLCRNRACVNPRHLEQVTSRVNTLRGDTFQARNAAKTRCPHGHEYTVENTYTDPRNRRYCKTCRRNTDMLRRMDGRKK